MKIFYLFLFTLVSSILFAQESNRDVVYLKNGSIIKGQIIEQIPNQSMTIKTSDGSTFVYPINEIKKIGKEESSVKIKKKHGRENRFSYYSFNIGAGTGFKMNLVDLNIAGNNGWGGTFKWGASVNINSNNETSGLGYLIAGPSYAFSAGNTIGTVSLMAGIGRETRTYVVQEQYGYTHTNSVSGEMKGALGVGYTHRFFTNHKWNLLLGADIINDTFGVNLGFAYSW